MQVREVCVSAMSPFTAYYSVSDVRQQQFHLNRCLVGNRRVLGTTGNVNAAHSIYLDPCDGL